MSNTPIQNNIRNYALAQLDAAYIMGATAVRCTPKYRRVLAEGRSSAYADKITDNCPVLSGKQSSCDGCKHQGALSFDCAQLSKFSAKAGGVTLPSGSNSQWTKVDWAITGEIASMPMSVVCFVFHHNDKTDRKSHVGVYLGDGTVIDARGHASDVKHEDVSSYPWTHYAIPVEVAKEAGFDLTDRPTYADERRPTIRKGSKGDAVREAQQLLNTWDDRLQLAEDGVFGTATKAAVEAFQQANGLTMDGILGPNTWAALLKLDVDQGEDDDDPETMAPEEQSPAVAALMADVDQAMEDLRSAVKALVDAMAGRG